MFCSFSMFFLLQIVQFIIHIFLFKNPYNPVFNVIGNCHERDEVEDSSAEESGFLIIQLNKRTKTTLMGKKQAGRLVHSQT